MVAQVIAPTLRIASDTTYRPRLRADVAEICHRWSAGEVSRHVDLSALDRRGRWVRNGDTGEQIADCSWAWRHAHEGW